jgi:hypothetical protein
MLIFATVRLIFIGGRMRSGWLSLSSGNKNSLMQNRKKQRKKRGLLETVVGIGILAVIVLFTMQFSPSRSPSTITSIAKPGCTIKGNISINTGNKFYHLPGMEDYESTAIDLASGERWFCTESEAKANGWRKAPR